MNAELERIKSIRSFPSLVKYLREELEWKIDETEIDELTFEYDAEELGIDKETAVKIAEIKQLRPLVSNQPWGVFYIKFEKKRLPIVALRRILRSLVVRKRESANRSQMATWEQNDLLFISSYGEENNNELSFAHFSDGEGGGSLPTLKVLGWSTGNSTLRLQDTYETLREKLHWPEDENNLESWRLQWSSAFKLQYRQTIKKSQELASRLADLASAIRSRVNGILATETETGPWRSLFSAFQKVLIHDLKTDDFADMYAQTISYGLLSARISRKSGALIPENLVDMIPLTNPFLRELMQAFIELGDRGEKIDLDEAGINEVIELLANADMEEVEKDFNANSPDEDPVIHFYELFLKEYDAQKKVERGVFYTPKPVVSFIVQSVHELLQKNFGLEDGLADITTWGELKERNPDLHIPKHVLPDVPFVQILDPATGTGTFLIEVIDLIHKTLESKWKAKGKSETEIDQLWSYYVPKHLLPRLFGFELMMAPYVIAHMKISLKLAETRCYMSEVTKRAQIYLTNALEEPITFPLIETIMPALANEAEAANRIKANAPITVVVGNPPYSGESKNKGKWIMSLMEDYKKEPGGTGKLKERNSKFVNDDYVKFMRFAQHFIDKNKVGVSAYINNHGFLDNPTFRGMRWNLLKTSDEIYVVDLHGNSKKKEVCPDGSSDKNVFDIQPGVSINFFIKTGKKPNNELGFVFHFDVFGLREKKYDLLISNSLSTIKFSPVVPSAPEYFFDPKNLGDGSEYRDFIGIIDLFEEYSLGVLSKNDDVTIDFDRSVLSRRITQFRTKTESQLRSQFDLKEDSRDWVLKNAIADLNDNFRERNFRNIVYRPFDDRWTYFTGRTRGFFAYSQTRIMRNFANKDNYALIIGRTGDAVGSMQWNLVFITVGISDQNIFYRGGGSVLPLYLYPDTETQQTIGGRNQRFPNLDQVIVENIAKKIGETFSEEKVDVPATFAPIDILDYVYAVLHSQIYREKYKEFLKIDFPRVPYPESSSAFRLLFQLGSELRKVHLLKTIDLPPRWDLKRDGSTLFQIAEVAAGFPKYEDGKVFINNTAWFDGVAEEVWNFHIGGYQVCHKLLKDRKGRTLSPEDIAHYGKITVALRETIRLMAEIDEVIDAHGGFPLVGSGKT